jgi:hypothetical protein
MMARRGKQSMTRRANQRKPNGNAVPNGRANGHGPASTERDGIPAHRDRAASDDANGASVARAASSAIAAGTDREAYAEAAPSRPNGAAHHYFQETHAASNKGDEEREVPPGEHPLPADPAEFVEEIHRKIDLTVVWHDLLSSTDEKIKQRAVEKLTEMRYKGASALADEPPQVVIDIDSAVARRAAEGANK